MLTHHNDPTPVEWKVPAYAPSFVQKFPRGLGIDLAGVVVRTGTGLTAEQQSRFQPGTRVMGMIPVEASLRHGQGSLSTHVTVRIEHLVTIPGSIDRDLTWEQAAGLTLVALTALGLVRKVRPGNKVLVCGGSTSVGLVLLQMLRAEGAGYVVATASGEKKTTVREKGADEVIDYRQQDVVQTLKTHHSNEPFDVILDTVGDFSIYRASPAYLHPSGCYANIGASDIAPDGTFWSILKLLRQLLYIFVPWWLGGVPRKASVGTFERGALPEVMEKYLVTGKVTCPIDSTYTFDQAPQAYQRLMTGRALGKIVVNVK